MNRLAKAILVAGVITVLALPAVTVTAFAQDAIAPIDTDGDGIDNLADDDDDGDGVPDQSDAFPLDWSESTDRNGNGIGDNADRYEGSTTYYAHRPANRSLGANRLFVIVPLVVLRLLMRSGRR